MLKLPTNFLANATLPLWVGLLLLLSAWGGFAGPLWAASLQIQVLAEGEGTPLENASVCLGTSPNPQQFGAYLTDEKGEVWLDEMQPIPFILIVSKAGFRGEGRVAGRQRIDRVMVASLAPGGGGPACDVSSQAAKREPSAAELQVKHLVINGSAPLTLNREVTLSFTVEGEPTEYRASQFPDFRDVQWQAFVSAPLFELSPGSGEKIIYFQVRRYQEVENSYLQMVSNTIKENIYFSDR
ncbi:carboxypeptidase-like regulatory domain-containing protein [Nitrosococcus oceani]|uniref:Uncharacterized protein n=2 Tax=Nitrosococcus oceani TaxID=1229 RepID=Q3J7L8_NITOC|nr:carboxypeptidase-like regulatory domain-containing protein [Nitrosococcus oceani]ABA59178.1 hypothetical protein Noc_2725 [Nitrosococcus oceani ATCC 19707]KFI18411.1 hypothetical protein IB75_14465 [Nitrosococcus oceani C-27]KFI21637.1 hypothetical protein HW44_14120 [Nitrosococcus oceani]GEM20292.1 hypothetical protein NONS58_17050 [Nitrosococcus oceani]